MELAASNCRSSGVARHVSEQGASRDRKTCDCHRSCRSVDDRRCRCCCCWWRWWWWWRRRQSALGQEQRRGAPGRQRHARVYGSLGRLHRRPAADADARLRRRCCARRRSPEMDDRRQRRRQVAFHGSAALRSRDECGPATTSRRPAAAHRSVHPAPGPHASTIHHQHNDANEQVSQDFRITETRIGTRSMRK